jgi:hypothetical protein
MSYKAEYIRSYYQPKEYQFCRAYTQTYRNLGVHTTQRNKGYHVVTKARLSKNTPLSKAIRIIVDQTKEIGRQYDDEINQQRRNGPRILDQDAFSIVKKKLTHYALNFAIREWSNTKKMADDIEEGKAEEFEFDPSKGCTFGCELPARYCLPCKHWLLSFHLCYPLL